METKQSYSEETKEEARRNVMLFQFRNMTKAYAKQFALILKMLLREDQKNKERDRIKKLKEMLEDKYV